MDVDAGAAGRANREIAAGPVFLGVFVVGKDGLLGILALEEYAELGVGDVNLFLVHAVLNEYTRNFLVAVVGDGVYAFLHRLVVAVAIGSNHNVVIHKVFGNFRQLFLDFVANDFRHFAGAAGHQVGVVVLAGRNHEIGLGGVVAQFLQPVQRGGGHVDEGNAHLFGYGLHGGRIVRMAVTVQFSLLEPAAGNGTQEHRSAAFLAHAFYEGAEVVLVGAVRRSVAGRIVRLGVVMAEFNEHVVAGLHGIVYLIPQAQVDEAFGAAPVLGIVDHLHVLIQEIGEHHAPAALLTGFGQVFFCHGAVPHQVDGEQGCC